ncbi:uncharacterized protein LOC144228440 [Crocuta crocuta]
MHHLTKYSRSAQRLSGPRVSVVQVPRVKAIHIFPGDQKIEKAVILGTCYPVFCKQSPWAKAGTSRDSLSREDLEDRMKGGTGPLSQRRRHITLRVPLPGPDRPAAHPPQRSKRWLEASPR